MFENNQNKILVDFDQKKKSHENSSVLLIHLCKTVGRS